MMFRHLALAFACCGVIRAAVPVALYEFDDASQPGKATIGQDLSIVGTAPTHQASVSDGRPSPVTLNGVITTVHGSANRLVAAHGIGANGGGTKTNRYTLVFDVLVPGTGQWRCFYQTAPSNNNDGEYFVRNSDNAVGRATIGYSTSTLQANRWHRLAVSVDLTTGGFFRTYLDGLLLHSHIKPALDSDFALDPSQILLFADNDNENHPLTIGMVAIFDQQLTANEIAALGGPGIAIVSDPNNIPPVIETQTGGPASTATGNLTEFQFTATDEDGNDVQVQADWGDGTLSDWSTLVPSGSPATLSHVWSLPGSFTVKARARDSQGFTSPWVEMQTVTVTGPPVITFSTPPYLQNMSTSGMVIMAEVVENFPLILEYGTSEAFGASVPFESVESGGGTRFIRAAISDLTPDTLYHFRISSPEGDPVHPGSTFRTAPEKWQDFTFGVIGDVQTTNGNSWQADGWEPAKTMLAHMVDQGVRFGLAVGDMAQDGNNYTSTKNSFLNRTASILGTRAPFYIAWGNHDGNQPTHPLRLAADMPSRHRTDTFSTHTSGFGSYSFLHSGVFFVCIEHYSAFTGTHSFVNGAGNDITNGWLDAQLASQEARDARFRIVAIHVPPYCERWIDGNAGLRTHLVPRLEEYGVDFCFSGHMHAYERGHLNGVNYVITGGGSYLDHSEPLTTDWPHMTVGGYHNVAGSYARQSSVGVLGTPQPIQGGLFHHYVQVTVRDRYLRLDTHGFNANGSYIGILDSMEIGTDPGPDSDGDGLRDAWELANGMDPHDATGVNGPDGDLDGDGQSNLAEWTAGTAANDPTSVFRILSSVRNEAGWELRWSSVPGKRYRILLSEDLVTWHPLGNDPEATIEASAEATTSHLIPGPLGPHGFARIQIAE